MRPNHKIVICIGALDIAYVVWTVVSAAANGFGVGAALFNLSRWGFPFPAILVAFEILAYVLILACGIMLVLRNPRFAWLNYALFPLRLVFFLPTVYPIFILGGALGLGMHPIGGIALLVVTEVACCVFIYFWRHGQHKQSASGHAAPVA